MSQRRQNGENVKIKSGDEEGDREESLLERGGPHFSQPTFVHDFTGYYRLVNVSSHMCTSANTEQSEMVPRSGRTGCLVFINNICLIPVTKQWRGGIDKRWRIAIGKKENEEKESEEMKHLFDGSVIETNAMPASACLGTTLIWISASSAADNMI